MTRRRLWLVIGSIGSIGILALIAWGASRALDYAVRPPRPEPLPPPADRPAEPTPQITATMFYGSRDGQTLVGVRREVPLGHDMVEQGRAILDAQLESAPDPYISVIPAGTAVRAFYVTPRGDAFVDLSAEIATGHPGGSLTELLTVYAIVNAVTANLPDVQRVQILVDGREVDTIAGHVDIRRPLVRDTSLVASAPADEP
jgi:hypothetical protein